MGPLLDRNSQSPRTIFPMYSERSPRTSVYAAWAFIGAVPFRRWRYLGRYFPILDDKGVVADTYEPASLIVRTKYPSSFTIPSTSLVPFDPSFVIFAYRWNSLVAFEGSISSTSTAYNAVISLAVELRDVIITCNLGALAMKYPRSI